MNHKSPCVPGARVLVMKSITRNGKIKQSKPVTLTVEKVFKSPNIDNSFVNVKFEGEKGLFALWGNKLMGSGFVYVILQWESACGDSDVST